MVYIRNVKGYIYIYMGLCRDTGKESGSYCLGLRV